MNYLAHGLLAKEGSPEFRFGAMAPDFANIGRFSLNVMNPQEILRLNHEQAAVQNGMKFHFRTDRIFDEQPLLREIKKQFRDVIAPRHLPENFRQIGMIASLGVDLLLDGHLQKTMPKALNLYEKTMKKVDKTAIGRAVHEPERFTEFIEGRTHIPDFDDAEQVTHILYWMVADRPRLALPGIMFERVRSAVEDYHELVSAQGDRLIDDTYDAVWDKQVQKAA